MVQTFDQVIRRLCGNLDVYPLYREDGKGAWVQSYDYKALEAENTKLKEALRGMMEATEAVDEWKGGEAPSFLGGYAFELVKAERTKAREVLNDKTA